MKKILKGVIYIFAFFGFLVFAYAVCNFIVTSVETEYVDMSALNDEPVPYPSVAELLQMVNEERAKVGVSPLVLDDRLNKSAQVKADDMLVNNYFGHEDKSGKHGYSYIHEFAPGVCSTASENITDNTSDNSSAQAVTSWKNSTSHYTAMVNPGYTLTGFGIAGSKIVQHFCKTT